MKFLLIWAVLWVLSSRKIKQWLDREPYMESLSNRGALILICVTALIALIISILL